LRVHFAAGTCLPTSSIATIRGYTYAQAGCREEFIKYAIEVSAAAVIYTSNFIKFGSGIQKLIGGCTDTQTYKHAESKVIL
jgi:hypothetical protein